MTIYIKRANTVYPQEDAENFTSVLDPATYYVERSIFGWFLQRTSDVSDPPAKIYGDVEKRADRVIHTYEDRLKNNKGTGVLLTGTKGSGKTMLAKMISHKLLNKGIPTIVVGAFAGSPDKDSGLIDSFMKFMNLITCPVLVLFDEFEKNFEDESQAKMLSMFDGTSVSNKLFILTANNEHKLNSFLINRPGRIYYRFSYTGLDKEFVKEYLDDTLNDKIAVEDIVEKIDRVFKDTFTFDMIQSVVEEMNRYNIGFVEALSVLNIDVEETTSIAKLFKGNVFITERTISGESNDMYLYDKHEKDYVYFSTEDFVMYDTEKKCNVFSVEGYTIELYTTKKRNHHKSFFFDSMV